MAGEQVIGEAVEGQAVGEMIMGVACKGVNVKTAGSVRRRGGRGALNSLTLPLAS